MTGVTNGHASTESPERPYLNIADTARLMGVSRDTVERLVAARELPVIRVSPRRRMVARADIDAYMAAKTDATVRAS